MNDFNSRALKQALAAAMFLSGAAVAGPALAAADGPGSVQGISCAGGPGDTKDWPL